MKNEYRKQARCTCHTRCRPVFATKCRRKIFRKNLGPYLQGVLRNVTRRYPGTDILSMETDEDRVRMLAVAPPKMAVSEAVRLLKTDSSRAMRARFDFIRVMYDRGDMPLWSEGYFVSAVGCDEAVIKKYIEAQGRDDKGQIAFDW